MSKAIWHQENPHKAGYDFSKLCAAYPNLKPFITTTKKGTTSINFEEPSAVFALNAALLKLHYEIDHWVLPKGYLCPAIPGRIEYLLQLKELSKKSTDVKMFDLGCGANGVYSLLATKHFGWTCVGVDTDKTALDNFRNIIADNSLSSNISLRYQKRSEYILKNVIKKNDTFEFLVCNPPFHPSLAAAKKANTRKRKNLGHKKDKPLNFGGIQSELVYPGGEQAFIKQLIKESYYFKSQIKWFSSLVSNEDNLGLLIRDLKNFHNLKYKILPILLGNKKSRILAWRFG